jgi:phosphoribosylformylglycinamidine cyclo-ligase
MLPKGLAAAIETGSWKIPPLFEVLRRIGNVPADDYRRTFNLGVGMILAVAARGALKAERVLARAGERAWRIGSVVAHRRGQARVEYR